MFYGLCGFFFLVCVFFFPATDFTLKPSDCPDTEFPVRVSDSDRGCLWYKKDNKFKIPKGEVCMVVSLHACAVNIIQLTRCFCSVWLSLVFFFHAAAYIRFHIISPVIQQSAKKWVQAQIWPCGEYIYCICPSLLPFPLCLILLFNCTTSIIIISLSSAPFFFLPLTHQCSLVWPAGQHPRPQLGRTSLWSWSGPAGV